MIRRIMVTDLRPIIRAVHQHKRINWIMLIVYCILAPVCAILFIEGVW